MLPVRARDRKYTAGSVLAASYIRVTGVRWDHNKYGVFGTNMATDEYVYYTAMKQPPTPHKPEASAAVDLNDVVQIMYEDDGSHIAERMGVLLSMDDVKVTVVRKRLTETDGHVPPGLSVTVIVMTPDLCQALENGEDEQFVADFGSPSRTIIMIPHQFTWNQSKEVIAKKYKNSVKWKETRTGTTGTSFKKAVLDVLELIDQIQSAPTLKLCNVVPKVIRSARDTVVVVFRSDVPYKVTVTALNEQGGDQVFTTTRMNSSMFSFRPDGLLAGEKQLEIKVGDASAGTCTVVIKSHMENFADILDEVTNPVSFMCDAMGVPERSKESLDNDFVDRLTNGQSDPHTQLLTDNYRDKTDLHRRSHKQYPTLLHFAAHYGLPRLCEHLLTYPGADIGNRVRNKDGRTAYDLAKQSEERYIAEMLVGNCNGLELRNSSGSPLPVSHLENGHMNVLNDVFPPPPLPPRREISRDDSFWTSRMTAVWENTYDGLSNDSTSINGQLEQIVKPHVTTHL